ncbi:hypothetical protein SASPL_142448 [Salvia splendens]|uniref:Cation/H+ exchanger transmembrane domain-containing protein n=1 Tax=Salvia splendens TaxID=180675 RepID=A0A8X8WJ58_SALSN|nr:hypothetical protein SASPL_142448 [Salvia splendens]
MGTDLRSVVETAGSLSTSDHKSVASITLFVTLLCACIVIGHLLEESRWINESITALIIRASLLNLKIRFQVKKKQFFRNFATIMMFGAIGTLVSFTIISLGAISILGEMDLGLDIGDYLGKTSPFPFVPLQSELFLLQQILFVHCRFSLCLCLFAVLCQDETPLLYSLVFGEGVVNDATSVVLFNAIQDFDLTHINSTIALQLIGNFIYLFISSTVLGVFVSYSFLFLFSGEGGGCLGLLSAYIIKKLYFGRHSTDREVAIMMLMAYLSYMSAELFYLSGILTVFFCGIVMSHYTWHNVTQNSRVTTKHTFATMSFVAETFIFLYVGIDTLDIEKWRVVSDSPRTSVEVSAIILGLILVGRAAFVFPLSFLSNFNKSEREKIGFHQQITIWWAGLMRGAVSMALAYNQFTRAGHTQLRGNAIMITSTITVVLFSTVVCGLITKPLVRLLMPSSKELNISMYSEPGTPKSFTVPLLASQDSVSELFNGTGLVTGADGVQEPAVRPSGLRMLLTTPTRTVHYYWRKFDDAFMRPVFGGRGFVPYVPGSPTEQSVHQWPAVEAKN